MINLPRNCPFCGEALNKTISGIWECAGHYNYHRLHHVGIVLERISQTFYYLDYQYVVQYTDFGDAKEIDVMLSAMMMNKFGEKMPFPRWRKDNQNRVPTLEEIKRAIERQIKLRCISDV